MSTIKNRAAATLVVLFAMLPKGEASSLDSTANPVIASLVRSTGVGSFDADVESLESAIARGMNRVSIAVIDGAQIEMSIEGTDWAAPRSVVLSGSVVGEPHAQATLVLHDGVLLGRVLNLRDGVSYEILPDGKGAYRLIRADLASERLGCHADERDFATPEDWSPGDWLSPLANPVIDILVAYTPSAERQQGGVKAMEALALLGIADTNHTLEYSGSSLRVRLAGVMRTQQDESRSLWTDLDRVTYKGDGYWEEVHTERTRLGADQVTLIGAYPNPTTSTAGLARNARHEGLAFSVVTATAVRRQFTLTHELGHNLGLGHDHGVVSEPGKFQTMMVEMRFGQPRIRRFSNPLKEWNGYRLGTEVRNEVAVINANASRVSGYR